MNCEDYREAIAAEPTFEGGEAHLEACAGCRSYRDDIRALDRRIEQALSLPVPELAMPELPELDTSNVRALPDRRRIATPAWFAIAATVVIAAFVGLRMFGSNVVYPSLADEIVAHLDHEPQSLRVTDEPVSDRRLTRIVPASVANMNHDAGLITYARTCVINGKKIPHLVLQGRLGPVTILLMPDEMIDGAVEIDGQSINGVILPVGSGSIAIIGNDDEDLSNIQDNVVNSVTWST
jgi:hypothetical protein